MKKYILLVFSIVLIAGCVGSSFTWDQVRQVKNGMTEPEVRHIMGDPQIMSVETNQIKLVYAKSSAFGDTRIVTFMFVNGIVTNFPVLPSSWQ
jgi:PBP1b-binding outer membrane lipoprotein LpoB